MRQFISLAIIKCLTESESVFPKRGIEVHFRAHLHPYMKVAIAQLCNELQVYNFTML